MPGEDVVATDDLIKSVRLNVDSVRDAMKEAPTDETQHFVSDLMLDIKQNQESLQKRASELVDKGNFDSTNEIFETIDLVNHLEPEYAAWTSSQRRNLINADGGSFLPDAIGANIHVEEDPNGVPVDSPVVDRKKKKKKKKKREHDGTEPVTMIPNEGNAWEPFPQSAPQGRQSGIDGSLNFAPWPVEQQNNNGSGNFAPIVATGPVQPASAVLTLGMTWDTIGPLLGDPGSSEEERKNRLGELMKEAIASECGITLDRIRVKSVY